jgi:hypothetical protein
MTLVRDQAVYRDQAARPMREAADFAARQNAQARPNGDRVSRGNGRGDAEQSGTGRKNPSVSIFSLPLCQAQVFSDKEVKASRVTMLVVFPGSLGSRALPSLSGIVSNLNNTFLGPAVLIAFTPGTTWSNSFTTVDESMHRGRRFA